jgi:dynein heavy chain
LDRNYEAQIYEKWQRDNTEYAISLLKNRILTKTEEGENRTYEVNFSPDLKVIIREAKYLDRIGKDIPQTIINIALQEKDYFQHVDKLGQLLREYNSALGDLKPVERKLLEKQI